MEREDSRKKKAQGDRKVEEKPEQPKNRKAKKTVKKDHDPKKVGEAMRVEERKEGELEGDMLLQEDGDQGQLCIFCERQRPIFLVDSDDAILRLPEKFLPPFLKQLKQDFLNKRAYLKFLRINSKFISCCACSHKRAHAYCMTAFVLRSQKIYCKDCNTYFHLYVKSERILSTEYLGSIVRLAFMFAVFGAVIYGIYYLDHYLKGLYIRDNENATKIANGEPDEALITMDDALNIVENSFVVVPLIVVLVIIMFWCFYLKFVMAFIRRKRLVWVEVQDFFNSEYNISRNKAK